MLKASDFPKCVLSEDDFKAIRLILKTLNADRGKCHLSSDLIRIVNANRKAIKIRSDRWQFSDIKLRSYAHFIRANSIAPLCSNDRGYFLTYNKRKIAENVSSLEARAKAIRKAANGLKTFL